MARAHFVKKARKDNPACNKGESYWWWQFRFGGKRYSKEAPKQSQLTQSEFLSQFYEQQEALEHLNLSPETIDDLCEAKSLLEDIKGNLESLQVETEDKQSSVEDAFPGGSPVIDLLEGRVSGCEEAVNLLDEAISTLDDIENRANERIEKRPALVEKLKGLEKKLEAAGGRDEKLEEEIEELREEIGEDLDEGELSEEEKSEAEDAVSSVSDLECPE